MVMCQTLDSVTVITTWTSIHIEVQHYLKFNPSKEGKEHKISMLSKPSPYSRGDGLEATGRKPLSGHTADE